MKRLFHMIWAILLAIVLTSCTDNSVTPVDQSVPDSKVLPSAAMNKAQAGVSSSNNRNFQANLNGANEVPPRDTRARGQAIFQLSKDGTELSYKLIVANIENVTMTHIHCGAAGENGPVIVWLYPSAPPAVLIPGRFNGVLAEGVRTIADLNTQTGCVNNFEDFIAKMRSGELYVNVHTSQYPPGEIRGQIK